MRRRSRGVAVLIALIALTAATASRADTAGATGAERDIAVSPRFAEDRRVWAVEDGTIHRSDDAGATWAPLGAGAPSGVARLAAAPYEAAVLYAVERGGRLWRTADAGASWTPAASTPSAGLADLAISPIDPATLLAATGDSGAALSTDAGDTWTAVADQHGGPTVAFGAEAALLVGDDDGRVHRSVDNGGSWTVADVSPGAAVTALAGGGDEVVYAGTVEGGVLRSDDDGRTFADVAGPDVDVLPAAPVVAVARSPRHATDDTVWVATASGVHRSGDRATTWLPPGDGTPSDVRRLVAAEGAGGATALFLAGPDGLLRSTDRGDRWDVLAAAGDGTGDRTGDGTGDGDGGTGAAVVAAGVVAAAGLGLAVAVLSRRRG